MGIFDKIMGQFIDVIEWVDASRDTILWKFPRSDNEIKNGAQLIVREGQAAVFLHEGELGDIFLPGRHQLTTNNIPILTTLKSWKYAFDAPFKCDVYFVNLRQFVDFKWGTKNPIMLRDAEFGPLRLRAFGTYSFQVQQPGAFVKSITGTMPDFTADMISGQLRDILTARFADALGESKIPALDLAANYNELGALLQDKIQPEFTDYGLTLTKLLVENISLPDEVEKALDQRTKMGVIGDLSKYTQLKTAEAIEKMAENPGAGSGGLGMIAGLGVGGVITGAMQAGATVQSAPAAGGPTPPPLPGAVPFFVALNGQQAGPFAFEQLRAKAASGEIARDTLVWKNGMAAWSAAGDQPELAGLFQTPPPLPR